MPRYPNETIMGEIGMFTQYWKYKESNLHWETNKIKKTKQHKSKITRKKYFRSSNSKNTNGLRK